MFHAVRVEGEKLFVNSGSRTLLSPMRCFAWDAGSWKERSLITPAAPRGELSKVHKSFQNRVQPFSMTAADLACLPRREWIIENTLARGLLTQLVAPGASGKSLLMLQRAVALAKGDGGFIGD